MKHTFWKLVLFLPLFIWGQLELPAVLQYTQPDFGATPGTWGHLQFSRPYGVKGNLLLSWEGLSLVNPINGEQLNTDRQGWIPHAENTSAWKQVHPNLTAPSDTIAPSLLVNYKQGEADFKDFTAWYHNSLGASTRYGWVSKLRSHQRALGVTTYNEQRHRLFLNHETINQVVIAEANYTHQINPLYMSTPDSSAQIWTYQDNLILGSERWDGYLHWHNLDSNARGSEFFVQVQGGIWSWNDNEANVLNRMAYMGHHFDIGEESPLEFKFGLINQQFGGNATQRHFIELNMPRLRWHELTADIGLKNLGKWRLLPNIQIHYGEEKWQANYATRNIIDNSNWAPDLQIGLLHEFQTCIQLPQYDFKAIGWVGDKAGVTISGYVGEGRIHLPWKMDVALGFSKVNQSPDWVWSKEQVRWGLDQKFTLFDRALFGQLKVWGRHLLKPQSAYLDPEFLTTETWKSSNSEEPINLLNYTIQAQISTMIIGFTDTNILQDPLWEKYISVPWDSEYSVMVNQYPQSRFRYMSVIWVFDN